MIVKYPEGEDTQPRRCGVSVAFYPRMKRVKQKLSRRIHVIPVILGCCPAHLGSLRLSYSVLE